MPLTCIAIDDEPPALALLKNYIGRETELQLTGLFEDALAGTAFLQKNKTDLLFIDINMPDITGLDLVRNLEERPLVIFTTAHSKFAVEGFELDAIDYLLKPITPERFSKAVAKAVEYAGYRSAQNQPAADALFVFAEYRMIKIPLEEIVYIESLEDYIRIHLINEKPVMTLMTMKKVLEKLPASRFSRIHRSYIVAKDRVTAIRNRKAIVGTAMLPISDSYLGFIKDWKK